MAIPTGAELALKLSNSCFGNAPSAHEPYAEALRTPTSDGWFARRTSRLGEASRRLRRRNCFIWHGAGLLYAQ